MARSAHSSTPRNRGGDSTSSLAELIERTIERGATSVEEIHRSIASLPLEVMEQIGFFERTARDVRRIQDESIGVVYDRIRHLNHEVARLAADLLERGDRR